MMTDSSQNIWSQWLLHRRFGGDPQRLQVVLDYLYPIRDKVLNHAELGEGEILLDVGCGDGLIAFGALEKVKTSRVIFSDSSQALLDLAQSIAREAQVINRCEFLRASADNLSALNDASVDVVTTRSVLIYVSEKQKAFKEFYRVLKPKGRLSIFEPINRFSWPEPPHLFGGHDVTPIIEIAQKVKAVYLRLQPSETDPMLNFDERDLIEFAEKAGFREIRLELQAEVNPPTQEVSWEAFLRTAPNPKVPTLEEAMSQALTPDEAENLVAHLRSLVEAKRGIIKPAVAYLWAVKN